DSAGDEIDLRATFDDIRKAGLDEIPIELADEVRPGAPKYDPTTGELVRPIDLTERGSRFDPATIPFARRAVDYARPDLAASPGFFQIALRLFEPANLFVMALILLVHAILEPVNVMMHAGLFLVVPVWIIGWGFIISHYGNVIDETGPGERDELPRPLRDAQFYDDIWRPLTQVAGAMIVCFWPTMLADRLAAPDVLVLALSGAGIFFFPAVVLTLTTSGTGLNLRPDRVLGVIRALGVKYVLLVGVFVVAIAVYGVGLWRFHVDAILLFVPSSVVPAALANIPWWFETWTAYPALFAGLYLVHWFCWALGATYREHHADFPWVLQRHVPRRLLQRAQPGQLPAPESGRKSNLPGV
ncbi:MAG: hypothetical protein ACREJC_15975, partial [Tepidisphaeraceae bacterium]